MVFAVDSLVPRSSEAHRARVALNAAKKAKVEASHFFAGTGVLPKLYTVLRFSWFSYEEALAIYFYWFHESVMPCLVTCTTAPAVFLSRLSSKRPHELPVTEERFALWCLMLVNGLNVCRWPNDVCVEHAWMFTSSFEGFSITHWCQGKKASQKKSGQLDERGDLNCLRMRLRRRLVYEDAAETLLGV